MASRLRIAQYIIKRLPFFLLALKGVWIGLYFLGFSIAPYWFISELQAHSVAFCAVLAYYAYKDRHCRYLKVCILALLGLNVLNIIYYFVNFNYLYIYAGVVVWAGLSFASIDAIRETRRPDKRPQLRRS